MEMCLDGSNVTLWSTVVLTLYVPVGYVCKVNKPNKIIFYSQNQKYFLSKNEIGTQHTCLNLGYGVLPNCFW